MDWTDRHCRYFIRQLSPHARLYTEMVTAAALVHGNADKLLAFDAAEHPVALQLGGSDPKMMADASKIVADAGYDEININVGCPSDRVQNNMIGACLMAHPQLVAECLHKMQQEVSIPVTVKHRLGIDDMDSYEELHQFVATVKQSGCSTFIIHARKAILQGLSPKENRDIPPLKYDWVYQIKQAFPELEIIVNGGIKTLDESQQHLEFLDGVMVGREAYHNPYIMVEVDQLYGAATAKLSRKDVIEKFYPYVEEQLQQGVYLGHITRHVLGLFHGQRGGRQFRRYISENAHKPGADIDVLKQAVALVAE